MINEQGLVDVDIDQYEKDLIIETLQYRLENDNHLTQEMTLKDNLEVLMSKLEGEEYRTIALIGGQWYNINIVIQRLWQKDLQ